MQIISNIRTLLVGRGRGGGWGRGRGKGNGNGREGTKWEGRREGQTQSTPGPLAAVTQTTLSSQQPAHESDPQLHEYDRANLPKLSDPANAMLTLYHVRCSDSSSPCFQ